MDHWLSNIEFDTSNKPLKRKVLEDKPSGATDECWIGAALTETTDPTACAPTTAGAYIAVETFTPPDQSRFNF